MFVDTQKVGFVDWIRVYLRDLPSTDFPLQDHQKVITRFMKDSPYRGILLYHGLGSGKSCAAIAAAAAVSKPNVFVMLPASLRPNFENEISKCGKNITRKITWVSTNGIQPKSISRNKIKNVPVNDSCIIIDEVHNLISQVVNGGKRGTALFDAIFHASNVKLIVLSGTPIINNPFEIGMLLNMINGPERSHLFKLKDTTEEDVSPYLKENQWVNRYDFQGKSVRVWLTPFPFYKDADGTLVTDASAKNMSEQIIIKDIWERMGTGEYDVENRWLYPPKEEEFNRTFLNGDLDSFINTDQFKRKALGKVSYFKMSDAQAAEKGFPTIIEKPPTLLQMSGMQFDAYILQRTVEIQLEMRLQESKRAKQDQISSGVFRAFSRAVCNFAFDNESSIKRVFPSSYKAMIKELDTPDAKEGDMESVLPTYEQMLQSTLSALDKDKAELKGEKLKEHSPKFHAILDNISKKKEKCLVYSQFRKVEGIGILEIVLRANGFSKFTIDSQGKPVYDDIRKPQFVVFDSTDKSNRDLIRLYNNDTTDLSAEIKDFVKKNKPEFRVLFITQSGAEGINLKEVRSVHVVEPYWNEIRIQQVIGRAARVDSHSKLPVKDRNVTVYRYIMEVPRKHDNFTIRNVDKNLSTDQIVLANAKDKMTLVDSFLNAIRAASIDCKTECYAFPRGLDPDTDMRDLSNQTQRMQVIERAGTRVLHDPGSSTDYDYKHWKDTGKLKRI